MIGAAATDGFLAPSLPRVLAHRGLTVDAPENTMLAFVKALSSGAAYLETDVHLSHDGVAVLSHDADLARLTGRQVRINQLTMAELRRIDVGAGQTLCSLADVLDAFPAARVNIDVKSDGAEQATADAISATRAWDRVLVASFSESRRKKTLNLLPRKVATSASSGMVARTLLAQKAGWGFAVRRLLADVDAVQIPEFQGRVRIVTPQLIRQVHAAGVEVHVWTVNSPDSMHRLLDMGVDGLITDRCDIGVGVIAARRAE